MGNQTLSCIYSFPLILNVDFSHVPLILNAGFSHVPLKIPRGGHCPMHAKTHQDHWCINRRWRGTKNEQNLPHTFSDPPKKRACYFATNPLLGGMRFHFQSEGLHLGFSQPFLAAMVHPKPDVGQLFLAYCRGPLYGYR